jgi:hypothetical protein
VGDIVLCVVGGYVGSLALGRDLESVVIAFLGAVTLIATRFRNEEFHPTETTTHAVARP